MAELLSPHFDGNHSRDLVNLLSTRHQSNCLTTFAFRSQEESLLLFGLDSCNGIDHWVCFIFFNRTADVLAPRVAVEFRLPLHMGSFSDAGEWLMSPQFISKGQPSSSVANYRQIYLSAIFSKVFEHLVSVRI